MKKFMGKCLRLLGLFLIAVTLGLITLYFNQEKLVFHPTPIAQDHSFKFASPFEEKNIEFTHQGKPVKINYLVFNSASTLGTILYFHGNAGNLINCGETADQIAQRTGWSVWMMDYPGFGKSSPDLAKNHLILLEMAEKFIGLIQNLETKKPLVAYGRSLGSGIASMIAAKHPKISLILETPYSSLAKIGHQMYPMLPESFSRFDLDTLGGLRNLEDRHVLILHGDNDQTIPVSHGRELAQVSTQHRYVEFKGGDHDNLDSFALYWTELELFLKSVANGQPV